MDQLKVFQKENICCLVDPAPYCGVAPCVKCKLTRIYQILYLQTNPGQDIIARFRGDSGRVEGFICYKHMSGNRHNTPNAPEPAVEP